METLKSLLSNPIVVEALVVGVVVAIAKVDPTNKFSGGIKKAGELLIKLGEKLDSNAKKTPGIPAEKPKKGSTK